MTARALWTMCSLTSARWNISGAVQQERDASHCTVNLSTWKNPGCLWVFLSNTLQSRLHPDCGAGSRSFHSTSWNTWTLLKLNSGYSHKRSFNTVWIHNIKRQGFLFESSPSSLAKPGWSQQNYISKTECMVISLNNKLFIIKHKLVKILPFTGSLGKSSLN